MNLLNVLAALLIFLPKALGQTGKKIMSGAPVLYHYDGSCRGPPALCCQGTNNFCTRGVCFCDSACTSLRDCCPDYVSTCQTTTTTPSGVVTHTDTSPVRVITESTSPPAAVLTASTSTGTTATLQTSTAAEYTSGTASGPQSAVAQFKMSILSTNNMQDPEAQDAVRKFVLKLEAFLQEKYNMFVSLKIALIKKK